MMRKIALTGAVLTIAAVFGAQAQQKNDWCGSDHYLNQWLQDPNHAHDHHEQQAQFDAFVQQYESTEDRDVEIIPVVFHIIHDNGLGDIPREQVLDAIDVLNEDFRRTNADATDTRSVFQPFAADSEIEFRLAQIDPDGNCTSGITRTNSAMAIDADNDVKSLVYWPSNQYMNIWVVETINSSGANGIILGYAQFPGTGSWNTYGIVVRNDRIARSGIGSAVSDGRTLTHEVGHCLNLLHTFQSGCGGNCASTGDRVCDTPPVDESTQGCNFSQNSCNNDLNGSSPYTLDAPDQIENYMSYDDCQNMFSEGQKTRMQAALAFHSQLQNLVSASNLTATGTDGNDILCAADFTADLMTVCVGEVVTFTDQSYHAPTGWSWEFPGGEPAVSSTETQGVVYSQPGLYDVKLTVNNGTQNTTTTKTQFLRVLPSPGYFLPIEEGFEGTAIQNGEWEIVNYDGAQTWVQTNLASATGLYSVKIDNVNNSAGATDELVSPSYDLSTMTDAQIKFDLAYAQRFGAENDQLRLFVSTDCGETWALRWAASGSNLATAIPHNNTFTPSSGEWIEQTVNIPSLFLTEHFLFKLEFNSDGGNDIYIDDINIVGTFNPVPQLVHPEDGSPAVSPNVMVDWKSVGDVNSYEYEIDTDPGFNGGMKITGNNAYIGYDPDDTDTEYQNSGLTAGWTYYWRVRTVTNGVQGAWSNSWSFTVDPNGVGIDEIQSGLADFRVFPNPMTGQGVVSFELTESKPVRVEILNLLGQPVLLPQAASNLNAGTHRIPVDGDRLSAGVYLVKLTAGERTFTRRLVVD